METKRLKSSVWSAAKAVENFIACFDGAKVVYPKNAKRLRNARFMIYYGHQLDKLNFERDMIAAMESEEIGRIRGSRLGGKSAGSDVAEEAPRRVAARTAP